MAAMSAFHPLRRNRWPPRACREGGSGGDGAVAAANRERLVEKLERLKLRFREEELAAG